MLNKKKGMVWKFVRRELQLRVFYTVCFCLAADRKMLLLESKQCMRCQHREAADRFCLNERQLVKQTIILIKITKTSNDYCFLALYSDNSSHNFQFLQDCIAWLKRSTQNFGFTLANLLQFYPTFKESKRYPIN